MMGWLLITSAGLQNRDLSHLPIDPLSHEELSWVMSSFTLSAIVGAAYISWLADGFGKKHTLCTLSLAHFVSPLMHSFISWLKLYLHKCFDVLVQLVFVPYGYECNGNVFSRIHWRFGRWWLAGSCTDIHRWSCWRLVRISQIASYAVNIKFYHISEYAAYCPQ